MRAVIARDGKPIIAEISSPTPKPDELLVQVKAAALNRADLLQVKGQYPPPPGAPETLGMEFAGEVISVGAEITSYKIRDRVMALIGGGAYADQAVVPAAHVMPVPDRFSDTEAAAIPEAFLTAFSNMVEIGRLTTGETVLIHAAASGVGLAAIQIARIINATIIITASAPKHAICKENGADITIDYKTENFADRILAEYDEVDLVIDFIGAPYWDDNVRVLKKWGRLVLVGTMGGTVKEVNFGLIMRKRLSVMGSTLRDRTYEEKAGLITRFWSWSQSHFESRALHPTVWRTLPLEDVEEAHRLMSENANAGKIVLTL